MRTEPETSANRCGGIAWWGWLLGAAVGSIAAIILITWWREVQYAARLESSTVPEPSIAPSPKSPSPASQQPATEADKLSRIKGIGPKTAHMLNSRGITTFEQLANTEVSYLQALLAEWDWRFIDPTSWPEQAQVLMQAKK